jgi:hypothetical protein
MQKHALAVGSVRGRFEHVAPEPEGISGDVVVAIELDVSLFLRKMKSLEFEKPIDRFAEREGFCILCPCRSRQETSCEKGRQTDFHKSVGLEFTIARLVASSGQQAIHPFGFREGTANCRNAKRIVKILKKSSNDTNGAPNYSGKNGFAVRKHE